MFYTLAGAAKRTGLGEFTILRAIEEGQIAGLKDLFGDWQVHELELHALNTAPKNTGQPLLENKTARLANDPHGETLQIFGPVLSHFNNERAAHHSPELVSSAVFLRLGASTWEHELWPNDEKIAAGVPHSEKCKLRKLPITGIMLVALGWAGGLASYHFLSAVFTSSNQSFASGKQAPVSNIGKPSGAENSGKAAGLSKSNAGSHTIRRRMISKPMLDQQRETTASIKHQQDRLEQDRVTTPFPDTRPTSVSGWTLKSVSGGIALLEGPYGTWKAARGDLVPGLGTVDSIVLWGNRWIVATTRGLVTTP